MATRIISAGIGLPILFTAVWLGPPWFSAFVFIIALLAAYELSRLANLWGDKFHWGIAVVLTATFISSGHQWAVTNELPLGLLEMLEGRVSSIHMVYHFILIIGFLLMIRRLAITRSEHSPFPVFGVVLSVSIYAGGFLMYGVALRGLEQGLQWVILTLLTVFATDTAAFFGGRAFGRTPLAPNISPNKTREGAVIGMFAAVIASVIAANWLGINAIMWETIILGVIIGAFAQLGDLLESRMKRKAGVKDSGALLPGHGGILDRIDSIVFTLPAVYYFVIWEIQQKGLLS